MFHLSQSLGLLFFAAVIIVPLALIYEVYTYFRLHNKLLRRRLDDSK